MLTLRIFDFDLIFFITLSLSMLFITSDFYYVLDAFSLSIFFSSNFRWSNLNLGADGQNGPRREVVKKLCRTDSRQVSPRRETPSETAQGCDQWGERPDGKATLRTSKAESTIVACPCALKATLLLSNTADRTNNPVSLNVYAC